MRSGGRLLLLTTLGYFGLWACANAPALRGAWWFFDDFSIADVTNPGAIEHHLEQGRPGQLLWMYTFLLDGRGDRTVANVALRLVQGGLHCLAGALAAFLLFRETRRRSTLLAGLPFVLWPYAGETVLWRTAGEYPLAACMAVAAVWLIRIHRDAAVGVAGAAVIAAAFLTHQLAAGAGLVVWVLCVALIALRPEPLDARRLGHEALLIANGYAVGGAVSVAIAWLANAGDPSRLTPAADVLSKLHFLHNVVCVFWTSSVFYPAWVSAIQIAIVLVAMVAILWAWEAKRSRRGLALLAVLATLATPYAAQLVVADNQVSWRILVLAPFVLGACWAVARSSTARPPIRWVADSLFVTLLAAYLPLAWHSSAVYPALHQADRNQLRSIEDEARAKDIRSLTVDTETDSSNMNPYGLDVRWGGAKPSAFSVSWSTPAFVRWYSWLEYNEEPNVENACHAHCRSEPPTGAFRLTTLRDAPVLCLCQP